MPGLNNTSLVRRASPDDAARIRSIARAAYNKYISRIGRELAPMLVDLAAEIVADHVVVIETLERSLVIWLLGLKLMRISSTILPLNHCGRAKA